MQLFTLFDVLVSINMDIFQPVSNKYFGPTIALQYFLYYAPPTALGNASQV